MEREKMLATIEQQLDDEFYHIVTENTDDKKHIYHAWERAYLFARQVFNTEESETVRHLRAYHYANREIKNTYPLTRQTYDGRH